MLVKLATVLRYYVNLLINKANYIECSLCRLIKTSRTSYQQTLVSPGKLKVIHSVIT
jgi:hypothetical protein